MIQNKYGHLSDDHREFVITNPRTPRPWFNYMWNERYGGLISHTGGGFSFLDSPRDNRLTRMRYNSLPWDRPGRYVIVKDTETGSYWSLSWAPTIDHEYDLYECHHGQGYTTIITEIYDIHGKITYFVPDDLQGEIWRISLKDLSGKERHLEVYSFTELLMGNALNDLINQPNDKHFTDIHFDEAHQALVATRRYWVLTKKVSVAQPNLTWPYNLHFTQTLPISGFDGSLDKFIGKWRSEANPVSIETGQMSNTEITAGDPVAALQSKITLEGNSSSDFAVIMALTSKDDKTPYQSLDWERLTDIRNIDNQLAKLKIRWDEHLSHVSVKTPDEKFNAMLNVWNQYQTAVTFDMARNAGYYHGGLLFGTGLRDQFQDTLGVLMVDPERVRARMLNALQYQFSDGSTLHNFFKLVGEGERTHHSDTPLWIPFGLTEYLKETGDFSILDEVVKFHDSGEATVYEHMVRALDFAIGATTERGLPKIMNGDWNDTLDKIGPEGKGETVWGGFFLAYVLQKSFDVIEQREDEETLNRFNSAYERLQKVINENCWDGEWYIRAFTDDGKPVGTSEHKQGKIFLNAQSWSVISGIAPYDRAKSALASCKQHLETPYGMQICWPAYREVEPDVGLISRCVPGKKENGSVFNHASAWFVLASLLNEDPEYAYKIYQKMMPLNSSEDIDRFETEPYVYPEYVTSPEHETAGQASHSWLTGSAVWMLRIGLDYILGIQPTLGGLKIDPGIPSHWEEYSVTRIFREKTYQIHISNPDNVNSGVGKITVNGIEVVSQVIDPNRFEDDTLVVEVILGK